MKESDSSRKRSEARAPWRSQVAKGHALCYLFIPPEAVLLHQRLRAGLGANARVETRSLEEFFGAAAAAVRPPTEGTGEPARAGSFHEVVRALTENLADVRVYRIDEINIPVYVLGGSGNGNRLGLSTRIVET